MKSERIKAIVRFQLVFVILIIAFIIALVMNINTGTVDILPKDIFKIIILRAQEGSMESNVIWKIRLPRFLTAAILGGALSVSGFLLQTFFRNPIAGPFVLGLSSGAKMVVGFVMVVMLQYFSSVPSYIMIIAAFVGASLSMIFVLIAASKVKNMSMLLVVGVMTGYICSAITDFFITFAKESDIVNLKNWSMGSFSSTSWFDIKVMAVVVFSSLFVVFLLSKPIEAYQLGEGYAKSMGINIKVFRILLILFASLLAATVTAFAGPIGFVGTAVPHITKVLMNTSKPIIVIPATFLCGGVFCTFCDLIARSAFSPTELAVGTVTAIFGAPVIIWLMISRKKGQ